MLPQPLTSTLVVLLVLATSVWLGGYVALVVVALTARKALEAESRVTLFRALGRAYLPVGAAALIVGLVSGSVLLLQRGWDTLAWVTALVALALAGLLAMAVSQARRMTRLRQRALGAPSDAALDAQVRRGARSAAALRAALGVVSVALVVLGSLLAV